jgi:K+-sensing histidine kinase KdpD
MCLICIELDKNAMTFREGRRALGEMRGDLDASHVDDVERKLDEAEDAERLKTTQP